MTEAITAEMIDGTTEGMTATLSGSKAKVDAAKPNESTPEVACELSDSLVTGRAFMAATGATIEIAFGSTTVAVPSSC